MGTRVRGQEGILTVTENGAPLDTFDRIISWDATFKHEILEENYTGFTTPEYDEIANGVEGNFEIHLNNEDYVKFMRNIENRAMRRGSDIVYNMMGIINHPSGKRNKITFVDVRFGDFKLTNAGRKSFMALSIPWKCARWRVVQ